MIAQPVVSKVLGSDQTCPWLLGFLWRQQRLVLAAVLLQGDIVEVQEQDSTLCQLVVVVKKLEFPYRCLYDVNVI